MFRSVVRGGQQAGFNSRVPRRHTRHLRHLFDDAGEVVRDRRSQYLRTDRMPDPHMNSGGAKI